ncbi:MAG: hypothetical protein HRK26_01465 [Rickettsiaceae bacterium H1]|nr:hypothetical protein [Rickettsiaceae bacterium H1]
MIWEISGRISSEVLGKSIGGGIIGTFLRILLAYYAFITQRKAIWKNTINRP